jgi:hypothetical protein
MQAQTAQFDPAFRSATIARAFFMKAFVMKIEVVLVSLPLLLLLGRSRCGTAA